MKHYYAVFKKTKQAVEVEFPDLPGCVSFGADWDEAIMNATDVLAAWLANAEEEFIKKPAAFKDFKGIKEGQLVPIAIDEKAIEGYKEHKRINIIFPTKVLKKIDRYRKANGLKRSKFLEKAALEYLKKH